MKYLISELIRKKRDGNILNAKELREIIVSYTKGTMPDYQMSALLMAILFKGFNQKELSVWTDAMLHSGKVMDHSSIAGKKVDKHSTGGVGDKISICLAPAVAVLGVKVPMISGRGLGHTGGTLDKLESIPGFNVNLSVEKSEKLLDELGLFLIGQTLDLAPADKKLYALRDVTGTVESIPLIASSIMSKKLAEGIDALVLDVKVGDGAFMKNAKYARELAKTLIEIGKGANKQVRALLTNMDNPIGKTIGNALEIRESIEVLQGKGPKDTVQLTIELGAEMLVMGNAAQTLTEGRDKIKSVLNDNSALNLFAKLIEQQGGDPEVCFNFDKLPTSKYKHEIKATQSGFIKRIFPRKTAIAALEVGAGRRIKEDTIDPACGIELMVCVEEEIKTGQVLAVIHHNKSGKDNAIAKMNGAFLISNTKPKQTSIILERL